LLPAIAGLRSLGDNSIEAMFLLKMAASIDTLR
jgi:hypothetical protein